MAKRISDPRIPILSGITDNTYLLTDHPVDGTKRFLIDNLCDTGHTHNNYLEDAPNDNEQYVRKNGSWVIVTSGSNSAEVVEWTTGEEKPVISGDTIIGELIEGLEHLVISYDVNGLTWVTIVPNTKLPILSTAQAEFFDATFSGDWNLNNFDSDIDLNIIAFDITI